MLQSDVEDWLGCSQYRHANNQEPPPCTSTAPAPSLASDNNIIQCVAVPSAPPCALSLMWRLCFLLLCMSCCSVRVFAGVSAAYVRLELNSTVHDQRTSIEFTPFTALGVAISLFLVRRQCSIPILPPVPPLPDINHLPIPQMFATAVTTYCIYID